MASNKDKEWKDKPIAKISDAERLAKSRELAALVRSKRVYRYTGRPRLWKDKEELQTKIDEYFVMCEQQELIPTISGLAVALDTTRDVLAMNQRGEYKGKYELSETDKQLISDLSSTIAKAKAKILAFQEQLMLSGRGNVIGLIFSFKNNFGWADKREDQAINDKSDTTDSNNSVNIVSDEDKTIIDGILSDAKPLLLENTSQENTKAIEPPKDGTDADTTV